MTGRVEGVEYTPEAIEAARQDLIVFRDAALDAERFDWAVLLSHVIAYLGDYGRLVERA